MRTADQILSSELHGEALLTAKRPELQPLIAHLREVAQGRDDIRVECTGTIAGSPLATIRRQPGGVRGGRSNISPSNLRRGGSTAVIFHWTRGAVTGAISTISSPHDRL
jgi:hypothetical protein